MALNIGRIAQGLVVALVAIMVVLLLFAALAPEVLLALTNVTNSGIPLATLFSPTGILAIVISIAVFLAVLTMAFKIGGGK